jgi:hypothetical protein
MVNNKTRDYLDALEQWPGMEWLTAARAEARQKMRRIKMSDGNLSDVRHVWLRDAPVRCKIVRTR